jgi:hypothetical protein
MNTPAAPDPVITRPTINCLNVEEVAVTIDPTVMMRVEPNMQRRGLKTWDSRPNNGASPDMAIRYEDVSQLACSKASRSAAIDDWVVVRMEMLVANQRKQI